MANDFNHAGASGRLTRDPELKYTNGGVPVCTFSIANNRIYMSNGEAKEQTSYFDIVVWRKQAETCSEHLKKGRQVIVDGKLQQRSWEDGEGKKHKVIEIVADYVHFVGAPSENGNGQQGNKESGKGEKKEEEYQGNPFADE